MKTLYNMFLSMFLFFLIAITSSTYCIHPITSATTPLEESMERMVQRLKTQQGELFDAQFLKLMIKHHQRGKQMAELAEKKAVHRKLREMAHDMAKEQSKEIAQMKAWQKEWKYLF